MNMVEHLDLHADWQERQAEAADERDERTADKLREGWDDCLKARSIDAGISGGLYDDLMEVLDDACTEGDQTINRALMQALVHCAAKGQIEAVEALDKVKAFFVIKTMEFHK
jgi:hypothetical protein